MHEFNDPLIAYLLGHAKDWTSVKSLTDCPALTADEAARVRTLRETYKTFKPQMQWVVLDVREWKKTWTPAKL